MAESRLDDLGQAEADDVIIDAPGLEGELRVTRRDVSRPVRGDEIGGIIDEALATHDMRTEFEVEVVEPRDTGGGGRTGRGEVAGGESQRMRLTVPAPLPDQEQVVFSIDEHGVATWKFDGVDTDGTGVRGGMRMRTYELERSSAVAAQEGRTRGIIPGADKIIRVITLPLATAIGRGAQYVAREWDTHRHPASVRAYGPDGTLTVLDDEAWRKLGSGRALMFVHGTFSSTEGGFGRLPVDIRRTLHDRYGGRVVAYDHPTIADDPIENARAFFEIANGRRLDLDIVCHSRGGLVSRSIAERPGDLADVAGDVNVQSIVLVGVPSAGTILASVEYWNELVDRMTTLLTLFGGPGATATLETILAVVKTIALKTGESLEGLSSMVPGGPFLERLNRDSAPGATYRAIVSDFEPANPGLKAWLNDAVRDAIFSRKANDMMVTIESMTGENGSSRFPVVDVQSYDQKAAVEHAGYFPMEDTGSALLRWLAG